MGLSFLDDYELVEDRIRAFWADHPDGRITTTLLPASDGHYIVHAAAYRADADAPTATGLAEETVGSSKVNETSALENCETSAIGRALANMGYAAKGKRPSREEMSKVGRQSEAPHSEGIEQSSPTVGAQCPVCGSEVYDNRAEILGTDSRKPLWRCKNKECQGELKKDGNGWWPWSSWDDDPFGPAPTREDFPPPELVVVPDAEPYENGDPDEAPF